MKILIINGPNINMLGIRETSVYGTMNYRELRYKLMKYTQSKEIKAEVFQSNYEGAIVEKIQYAYGVYDGIIINPAAYTHTSLAIGEAIASVSIPAVEVHISDPDSREEFRKQNYIRQYCFETVKGEGTDGYFKAIDIMAEKIKAINEEKEKMKGNIPDTPAEK